MSQRHNRWYVYLGIFLIPILLIFLFAAYYAFTSIKMFRIPTMSMEPTLEIGDHLLAHMRAYDRTAPQRGEIAIFKYPNDESVISIKRVIGLPGETVEIIERTVYIDGHPLKEPYVKFTNPESDEERTVPYVLPKDKYFVLGDNRDNSYDSRYWGFVDRSKFVGKARFLYWAKNSSRIGKKLR
jgi:signal peptidase I